MPKRASRGRALESGQDVLGLIQEAIRQTRAGSLGFESWRAFTEHRNPFGSVITVQPKVIDLLPWHSFYKRVLGRDVDLPNLHIPERPEGGFWRPIVNPRVFTNNELYDACAKLFPCWRYINDLNAIYDITERPRGPYVVWVKDNQESDEDLKNLSANDIQAREIKTQTFPERLIHGLKFYDETSEGGRKEGQHLDVHNWTLCTGSRLPHGLVPSVYWYSDYMDVYWASPHVRNDYIRARAAVSS